MLTPPQSEVCLLEGGPITLGVGLVACGMAAALVLWMFGLIRRSHRRELEVRRVRDLLIEGSIGQAILVADRSGRDPVLGALRTAIATFQATQSRNRATERYEEELAHGFGASALLFRAAAVLLVLGAVCAPVGLGLLGQHWANQEIALAVAAAEERFEGADTASIWEEGKASPLYGCPRRIGETSTVVLAGSVLLLGWWEIRLRGSAVRRSTEKLCDRFVEMAARAMDPEQRAYRDDRARPARAPEYG